MTQAIYTVTQVNTYIKSLMDGDRLLSRIYIRGEISNYKSYPSGHHYFSLKDQEGTLRCVMFRSAAVRLRFRPENGMKAIAFGRVTVFPRDGSYQLYVEALTPDGVGELYVAFEQLKAKLGAEGLFDLEHKKPVPPMPQSVGLITSGSGAAVHDMIRILGARWPLTTVKLLPVRVQGAEAPAEIAAAIRYANQWRVADVLIVGRGGGSMEDLWAFNEEQVARAIYASDLPVISAVGHEPDVTISDFVADLRAATPSNAAELVVPDQNEIAVRLRQLERRMEGAVWTMLQQRRNALERCLQSRALQDPMAGIEERRMLLDDCQRRLIAAMERILAQAKQRFVTHAAQLEAMSPLKVLQRGYAVVQQGETVIGSRKQVQVGEQVTVRLKDGSLACQVLEVRSEDDAAEEKKL